MKSKISMDELERGRIAEKRAPFEGAIRGILPCPEAAYSEMKPSGSERIYSLCGAWEMAEGGYTKDRLVSDRTWDDSVECDVPCSVHTALLKAGKIPDPTVGLNDKLARENSYKIWWLRKRFTRPELKAPVLRFEGVCYSAQIWLNGTYLGYHRGMFGAFEYDVKELLREENTLLVKIDNAPTNSYPYSEFADNDEGWKLGVVIYCAYGWHYACIPSRGIWAPVNIIERPTIACERPFFATIDEKKGIIGVSVKTGRDFSGILGLKISPKNFDGESVCFTEPVCCGADEPICFRFTIPEVKLWWPNGHGEQNLYCTELILKDRNGAVRQFNDTIGVRKLKMLPAPGGPDPETYNWQVNINGKDIFIKGTNWCTTDVLLRFNEKTYRRYLRLAKEQGVNLLRAWGGGMPESDVFYDICDELGLMVFQEWPTGWDSHKIQPLKELLETVEQHTVRLRNRASLVLWAGGNESAEADGYPMDRMAKIAYEMDGTRPFHRSDPCGKGTVHNYSTYWEMRDMDATLSVEGIFMGEYGMASAPVLRSVNRYIPEEERGVWGNPEEINSFTYHTPRFNQIMPWGSERDMKYLSMRVYDFNDGKTMEDWIYATQLAQATVLRHPIDKFRANYPASAGICYYKMNDVFPACGWSVVDFYGVQKPAYYVVQDTYAPLCACIVFSSLQQEGKVSLPVHLINDFVDERNCKVRVAAYGEELEKIEEKEFVPATSARQAAFLGNFDLTEEQTANTPLFITAETFCDGALASKTFYWLNFERKQGCLFSLPEGKLETEVNGNRVTLKNVSNVPLVALTVETEADDTAFEISDNFLWLNAGEMQTVVVNNPDGLTFSAWNLKKR